jgi:type II secretory pathway pseudopilin PulG
MTLAGKNSNAAFTLAEVLAALVFMAIVIPVVLHGLNIASLAGEVAQRKGQAARIAERVLNENLVTTNGNQTSQSGTVNQGVGQFNWTLRSENWNGDTLRQISVQVDYPVRDKTYSVRLSTLADTASSITQTATTQ